MAKQMKCPNCGAGLKVNIPSHGELMECDNCEFTFTQKDLENFKNYKNIIANINITVLMDNVVSMDDIKNVLRDFIKRYWDPDMKILKIEVS